MEEDIEKKYEKEKKKNTKNKVIIVLLIIIIILLLLFFLIGYKMGKIGFGYKQASAEPSQDLSDTIFFCS